MNFDHWLESPYQKGAMRESRQAGAIDLYDKPSGWMEWIQDVDVAADFEFFCLDKFWNILCDDFKSNLHPSIAKEIGQDPGDPIGDNWPYWVAFLYTVLDRKRFEILLCSYVNSNRDEFEKWASQ